MDNSLQSSISYNTSIFERCTSPALQRKLLINHNRRIVKNSIFWTGVNVLLLSIILYDLSYTCPLYLNYFHYAEYVLVIFFSINIVYYLIKIVLASLKKDQIPITPAQKKLLGIQDGDNNFRMITEQSPSWLTQSPTSSPSYSFASSKGQTSTPVNLSSSWRSSTTLNDSRNYSLSSSWLYNQASTPLQKSSSIKTALSQSLQNKIYPDDSVDPIKDEATLESYLKEHASFERINKVTNQSVETSNLLSSFWRHPVMKTAKDLSSMLQRDQYQLSILSGGSTLPNAIPEDQASKMLSSSMDNWTIIKIDLSTLTRWNENLRRWISQTILERLAREFDAVDDIMNKHCLYDIKIGQLGLDRLRKSARTNPIAQLAPSLATLIPFLEMTPNQEYLAKRIRQLAKGGCISEFRWNSGGSHNGKEWDISLPTDSAIVMHLFATYMDTQMLPSPSSPDIKPFSGRYFVKCTETLPKNTAKNVIIHELQDKPPHYVVYVDSCGFNLGKGYNNLFHSILYSLYHVNEMEKGMIGRVNLGKAGLNMLWIIDK